MRTRRLGYRPLMTAKTAKRITCLVVVGSVGAFAGCFTTNHSEKMSSVQHQTLPNESAPALYVWYVEKSPAGQHGYAVADGRVNYPTPDGGGLFPTLRELKAALRSAGVRKVPFMPEWGGVEPPGWKTRPLTQEEIRDFERW
jgi:hypothetical protein